MSKLSLHLQHCPAWVPQFIERSGVEWIKWIDPPEQDPGWGVKVVGRTFEPDGVSNARIWDGRFGALDWFNKWRPFYASRPYIWAWEAPNEPQPMSDHTFRACLNEFTVELARLMHGAGLRLVGMNWSVGWPDINHAPEMGEGVQACDYLGLHEYCAPAMWDNEGWLCLRYRRTVAELETAGYIVPPIIIGECGVDGGVMGQPKTGWKTHCSGDFDRYLQQLKWYSQEIDRDNVQAATIFTVCDFDWRDFAIDEPEAMALADWLATDNGGNGNGEEEPVDVKVFDVTGAERDWAWLTATYGAVNIQQPNANSYYKVVEIHERHSDSTFIARVLDVDGGPVVGKGVVFYWNTAQAAPGAGWLEQGVVSAANQNGDSGFGMGTGAYYYPPNQGPHKCWLYGADVSEMIEGIGMLGSTNHNHFNVVFQFVEGGNGGNGEDGDLGAVVTELKRCADALEKMAGVYK